MSYKVAVSEKAFRQIEKLDNVSRRLIINWIENKLENIENPRSLGKPLKGNLDGYWRYKIGKNYRVIVKIYETTLTILVIEVGHRKNIYE